MATAMDPSPGNANEPRADEFSRTCLYRRSGRRELEQLYKLGQIRFNRGRSQYVIESDPSLKLGRRHVLVIVDPDGGKRGH